MKANENTWFCNVGYIWVSNMWFGGFSVLLHRMCTSVSQRAWLQT